MRGDKLLKVLEIIEKTSINVANFISAFAVGKSESLRRLRNLQATDSAPIAEEIRIRIAERRRAQSYFNFLKRDGLVFMKNGKIVLAPRGYLKLNFLKKRSAGRLPDAKYEIAASADIVLIVFDIPEKRRRVRDWLRVVLKRLGLKMIQRSVWLGKVKIPQEFLDDLKNLKILENVEILAVNKSGSLNRLM